MTLSAILFLHDPSSNELWTQREDDGKVVQVPASLGLAGYSLSSCSTVFVDDVSTDQRFHAIVDQFVLSDLRHEPHHRHLTSSIGLSTGLKSKIALLSSALLSHDGIASAPIFSSMVYHHSCMMDNGTDWALSTWICD